MVAIVACVGTSVMDISVGVGVVGDVAADNVGAGYVKGELKWDKR